MSRVIDFLVSLALLAHPREVRARYGGEMARLLARDVADARARGRMPWLRSAVSGLSDIVRAGIRERVDPGAAARGSGLPWADRFGQDVRHAVRSLRRRPGFLFVTVLTLGLGIGATTAIFSVVNGVVLRSLPFPDPERLVRVWDTDRRDPGGPGDGSVSPVTFAEWRARATTFQSMALYATTRPTLTGLGEPEVVLGARVSPDFFEVLGAAPVLGRTFTVEEDLPQGPLAVVVSHGFWRERLGGRADALGSTLELNGRDHTVVGVAPPGLDFPGGVRLWLAVRNDDSSCRHGCVYLNAVGRLRAGATIDQAREDLDRVSDQLSAEFPEALTNRRAALASLHQTTVGDVRSALLLLLGAVAMVLLIACANVANLLIARGAARSDELAVRAALGAGRLRILSQLMTESLVLAVASAVPGILLAIAGVSALRALAPAGIPRIDDVAIDAAALAFAVLLALLTTVIFGLAPALRLARRPAAEALRQDAARTVGARRGIGRSALLAAEVGLSLILLVGAGLLLRSFAAMQRLDPGFAVDDVAHFTVSLPGARYPGPDAVLRFTDDMERRLEAVPGGPPVTISLGPPLGKQSVWSSFERTDRPPAAPGETPSAGMRVVGADFFKTMGIGIVAGRTFAPTDRSDAAPVVIINERLARQFFGGEDAVGRRIQLGISLGYPEDVPRTVIGVAEDVHWESLTAAPVPELFVPFAQAGPNLVTFLMRAPRGAGDLLSAARAQLQELDASLPFRDPGTMRSLADTHTAAQRFYLVLLAVFAALAVTLAAVGLYGVVAYLVTQRRREIGVRLALGAGRASVVRLVLRQGMAPAAVGAAAGLVIALAGTRVMSGLLFGVAPQDPLTFAATTALLLAVVAGACLVPAGRATRIPPATALRTER